MSLEKEFEDLSLKQVILFEKIVSASLSEGLNISDLIRSLEELPIPIFFTLNKYPIEVDLPESSCVFTESNLIIILTLTGKLFKINIMTSDIFYDEIDPQEERVEFSCNKFLDKVIIFGGRSKDNRKLFNDLLIFDLNEKYWVKSECDVAPVPRYRHCAGILNDVLIVYSGFSTSGLLRDVWSLDLEELNWEMLETQGYVVKASNLSRCCAVNNNLYIINVINDMLCYENLWLRLSPGNLFTFARLEIGSDVMVLQEILATCSLGNLAFAIGVNKGNFVAVVLNSVGEICRNVDFVEECKIEMKDAEIENLAFLHKQEIYLCRFYNNSRLT